MPDTKLYVVEGDTGRIMSKPMAKDAALVECRKWNSIKAGRPNSGTYRIVEAPVK